MTQACSFSQPLLKHCPKINERKHDFFFCTDVDDCDDIETTYFVLYDECLTLMKIPI